MALILGIETSCDETAVALVRDGRTVLANVIASQVAMHEQFGGVVPEQASREHVRAIVPALDQARAEAKVGWDDVDAIAVTHGPGLAGALLVGVNVAKGLSFAIGKPLLGINHLEGHVYANWLETLEQEVEDPRFPLVAMIVSGGHSDLVLMRGHGDYLRLGRTRDDAPGEAFDKTARLLGLGFPGGPAIERAAREGDAKRFRLPRAWLERDTLDVSFSGLKTAVLHQVRALSRGQAAGGPPALSSEDVNDVAAAFQDAVTDVLSARVAEAAARWGAVQVALGGGVAANQALLERVQARCLVPVTCPPPRLCTDNGAMVASAGFFRYRDGQRDVLDLDILPSLPIA